MTSLMRVLLVSFLVLMPAFGHTQEDEAPVADPALEQRLVINRTYKTKAGDTLKSLALFFYGHDTWWSRIKADNEHLQGYHSTQAIPVNTEVHYKSPEIGSTYVVQPNDWLIRIVQWKYGATDGWGEIYKKNAQKIANPNLIRPGLLLSLEVDGTVREANTGEVLVQGTNPTTEIPQEMPPQMEAPVAEAGVPSSDSQMPVDVAAAQAPTESQMNPPMNEPLNPGDPSRAPASGSHEWEMAQFYNGFLMGVLILWICGMYYWFSRNRSVFVDGGGFSNADLKLALKSAQNPPKPAGANLEVQRPKKLDRVRRKQSVEYFELDKSLIHRDDGEMERPSGYEQISTDSKKKHLKNK